MNCLSQMPHVICVLYVSSWPFRGSSALLAVKGPLAWHTFSGHWQLVTPFSLSWRERLRDGWRLECRQTK